MGQTDTQTETTFALLRLFSEPKRIQNEDIFSEIIFSFKFVHFITIFNLGKEFKKKDLIE